MKWILKSATDRKTGNQTAGVGSKYVEHLFYFDPSDIRIGHPAILPSSESEHGGLATSSVVYGKASEHENEIVTANTVYLFEEVGEDND